MDAALGVDPVAPGEFASRCGSRRRQAGGLPSLDDSVLLVCEIMQCFTPHEIPLMNRNWT